MVTLLVIILTGFILSRRPQKEVGIKDDLEHVNLERIITFAERSNSAYHEPETFRQEYGSHVEVGEFPDSGLRIYVDSNSGGEAQWVILRGTANMPNILADLEFVARDEHELGINVHAGFDLSLQACMPWLLERLDRNRPIWVTGHSLGGSVAALLLATLEHRGFKDVSAITFGQPKCTDAHGAGELDHLNLLRVVHDDDPVPLLPPIIVGKGELASYQHFGPEVIVKGSGHFYYLPEHSADRMDITSYWADLASLKPISHDMVKGYLPALKGALARAAKRPPNHEGS